MEYNTEMATSYGKVIVTPDNYMYVVGKSFICPANPNEPFSIIRWHKFDYTDCRFATEEETKEFYDELRSNGFVWDEKTQDIKQMQINLLFAKAKFLNEKKKECDEVNKDIETILERWFDTHESELREEYDDVVCWGGDWYYADGGTTINIDFSVGCGDESYNGSVSIFLDGHWERVRTF